MLDVLAPDQKKALIQKQACFAKLTEEEMDVLTQLFNETHVPTGTTIVTEGDLVDSVYVIVEGTADVKKAVVRDNTVQYDLVATLGPNDAIGLNETGFYSISGMRTASVVATSEMVLIKLSVAEFHGFALAYPHVNEVMRSNARSFLELK